MNFYYVVSSKIIQPLNFMLKTLKKYTRRVEFLCILIFNSKVKYMLPEKAMHGIQVFIEQ